MDEENPYRMSDACAAHGPNNGSMKAGDADGRCVLANGQHGPEISRGACYVPYLASHRATSEIALLADTVFEELLGGMQIREGFQFAFRVGRRSPAIPRSVRLDSCLPPCGVFNHRRAVFLTSACASTAPRRILAPGLPPIYRTAAKVNSSAFRACTASNSIGGR